MKHPMLSRVVPQSSAALVCSILLLYHRSYIFHSEHHLLVQASHWGCGLTPVSRQEKSWKDILYASAAFPTYPLARA